MIYMLRAFQLGFNYTLDIIAHEYTGSKKYKRGKQK